MNFQNDYYYLKHLEKSIRNQESYTQVVNLMNQITREANEILEYYTGDDLEKLKVLISRVKTKIDKPKILSKYYQDTSYCSLCNSRYKTEKFNSHILINHFNNYYLHILLELKKEDIELSESEELRLERIRNRDYDRLTKDLEKLIIENLKPINTTISQIEKLEYYDSFLIDTFESNLRELNANSLIKSIANEEILAIQERANKIIKSAKKRISKSDYISSKCNSIYTAWSEIVFQNEYIEILGKKIKLELKASRNSLNSVRRSFFERHFGDERYKLVYQNKLLRKDLSSGFTRIEQLIGYKRRVQKVDSNVGRLYHLFSPTMTRFQILDQINSRWNKNDYLKSSAQILNNTDSVKAVIENNNGVNEECVLFNYSNSKNYIAWENINESRATYVFSSSQFNNENLIDLIIDFISDAIDNKRSFLFSNNQLILNNYIIDYRRIDHINPKQHIIELKKIIGYP